MEDSLDKLLVFVLLKTFSQPEGSHEIHAQSFVVKIVNVTSDFFLRQNAAIQVVRFYNGSIKNYSHLTFDNNALL